MSLCKWDALLIDNLRKEGRKRMKKSWMLGVGSSLLVIGMGFTCLRLDGVIKDAELKKEETKKVAFWGKKDKQQQKADAKKETKDTDKKIERDNPEDKIYQWLQTYSEVIGLLEKRALRPIDFGKFIQDSLKSAVSQIDAHSSFFSRDTYKSTIEATSGEFSGIGISIITKAIDDDALTVVDVVPGSPAEKATMKPGDKIIEVDGTKLKGLSADEVVGKLKGKVGTPVHLKIIRLKKVLEFTVTRDIVKDQTSICYKFKNQHIYYLTLKIFNEVCAQQVEELLQEANKGKCRGIILDLRRNPGGTLDSAIDMAGLFLKKGSLVATTKDREGNTVASYSTNRDPVLKSEVPIFILIDNFTASASEILAGALRFHASHAKEHEKNIMMFLVGMTSFGKGSVQELIPVKNGCAVKITSMLYYLPGDKSIQAVGIDPDFVVKPKIVPEEEIKWMHDLYGKESSLKNHISAKEVELLDAPNSSKEERRSTWWKWLGQRDEKEAKKDTSKDKEKEDEDTGKSLREREETALAQDVQVQTAVNLINLLHLAKKMDKKVVGTREKALSFLNNYYVTDKSVVLEKIK